MTPNSCTVSNGVIVRKIDVSFVLKNGIAPELWRAGGGGKSKIAVITEPLSTVTPNVTSRTRTDYRSRRHRRNIDRKR